MNLKELVTGKSGEKQFLLGNEAAVRGVIEAGISIAATYPGTPSSEIGNILSVLAKDANIYFEFSTNEKVAMEVAATAAASHALQSEHNNDGYKHQHDDGCVDVADATPAVEPYFAAHAERLHSAPDAVGQVEPQGAQPYDIQACIDGTAECLLDPEHTVGGIHSGFTFDKLGSHHVPPEVVEVQAQAQADDDAENQHVLARPLYLLWLVGHFIAIVAACLPVLDCQPEGIDEVNGHKGSQANGCRYGIPVGAQHLTDPVVAILADECHNIH